MSDTNLPADPESVWARTLETVKEALATKLDRPNNTALFDALAAAGVTQVLVAFDGYGDSGQIESVEARAGDDVVELPTTEVLISIAEWGAQSPTPEAVPVAEAIERMAYDFLEQTHGGWENNDGAFGGFVFNVATRSITLDYNARFESSENFQHVF